MNSVVIHGEGLGKRYRRGVTADPGLRHALERFVKSPVAAFRREKQETFWALKDVSLEVKEGGGGGGGEVPDRSGGTALARPRCSRFFPELPSQRLGGRKFTGGSVRCWKWVRDFIRS